MCYQAKIDRYNQMTYRRCGKSGIDLPLVSLGLWHNFGHVDNFSNSRNILCAAFDAGVTHIDLANNYGPPYGSAEENFGKILKNDLMPYRDELFISSKAGYDMWPGPYGNWGSKKYLTASIDQSLKRMGLDYVDLFYHHRPDPKTPIEETMQALDLMVRQGKALYVGISNYNHEETIQAHTILKQLGTPLFINQVKYSMLVRWPEDYLLETADKIGMGIIAFSPLAQGILTNRYLNGIPANSRAAKAHGYLKKEQVTPELVEVVKQLDGIAQKRGQQLAQMALAWLLRDKRVTSVLIGASSVEQLNVNLEAMNNIEFSEGEQEQIKNVLTKIN
jgi:L-glyceraldehyde 3-phosphate reductase